MDLFWLAANLAAASEVVAWNRQYAVTCAGSHHEEDFVVKVMSQLLVALTLAVTGLLAVGASPAYAALDDCYGGAMCFWVDGDFSSPNGETYYLATQDSTFHNNPCSGCVSSKHPGSNGTWGDMISSYYNRTGWVYCLYKNTNYGTELARIQPGAAGKLGSSANDEVSSAKPC